MDCSSWMFSLLPILALPSGTAIGIPPVQNDFLVIDDQAKTPLLNPSMQNRKVAKIRLKNGVEAYMISDPDAKHSAAAVAVKVGSWNDPADYPGMAHFVEHVLFMGTKTYPTENDFNQFIAECSGSYNAFTSTDRTVYMFAVNHDGFTGALDRLSHFFIDPLLCTSSIERELHAVDQEHAKNIEHDGWRQWMIFKEIGNPAHPNAGFSTGNATTLSGIPEGALRSWYARFYTPENMRVIVISPLPKEKIVELVVEKFSFIERESSQEDLVGDKQKMFSKEQLGSLVAVKPIRDMKELSLIWELPSTFNDHEAESGLDYLAYLLNSPHEGGLIDFLKSAKWIQDGKAASERHGDEERLFAINFTLTEEGVRRKNEIIEKTFAALELMKRGISQEQFEEMRKLATLHYQYQTRQNAFDVVQRLGQKILDESIETFPERSQIPTHFSADIFDELVNTLTPRNCCYMLTADPKLSGYSPRHKEKWMGAEYTLEPIEESSLVAWENAVPQQLSLARANPFVPEALTLLPPGKEMSSVPVLLINTEQAKVYYQRDSLYRVPEAAMMFRIETKQIDGSARSAALTDLFCKAFQEKLYPTLHMAAVSGLRATLMPGPHFLSLTLNGYSEKAPKLACMAFAKLKKNQPSLEQFAIYKELLIDLYANASKELPCWQGKEILDHLLLTATPTQQQKLAALEEITHEEFITFSENLFKTVYVEGFIYGNCSKEEAVNISSQLCNALEAEPLPQGDIGKRKVRLLPQNEGPYLVVESTDSLGKAALLAIQQGPFTFNSRAKQLITGKFLHELFFDRLRTKQQTGYITRAKDTELEGQLIQLFLVQSNSHQPLELLARFDLFLDEFNQEFDHLIPTERFAKIKANLINELTLPPENLQSMAQRMGLLAFEYNADFAFYPKLIESIEACSYADAKTFVNETLSRKNTRRLALIVEGTMPNQREFIYKRTAKEEISSIGELETRSAIYPTAGDLR